MPVDEGRSRANRGADNQILTVHMFDPFGAAISVVSTDAGTDGSAAPSRCPITVHTWSTFMTVADLVRAARERIDNLSPAEVAAELDSPDTVLVDVREPDERHTDGAIPGALAAPRGMLEFHADPATPYHLAALTPDRRVILHCKSGARSALAGAALVDLGYTRVAHLDGGILAWRDAGRPVTTLTP
jgi:rhodanese-related sulfurtransferase